MDFSWTLDPDIAATMLLLAAIVVGLVATIKENYEDFFKLKSKEETLLHFRCPGR
jgi:nitrate reductase gamma subunit